MKTILLVEDEESIAYFLVDMFKEEGYQVLVAGDGTVALDMLQETQPDVILSDIMMPKMDGREMVRRIRTVPALQHIPIILMSAVSTAAVANGLGVNAFVPKPFDIDELLELIVHVIKQSNQEHNLGE